MKKLIYLFAACLALLVACSKDPKPDRATPFIGDWRTEGADSGIFKFQTFWKIERGGPNTVNIATSDSVVIMDDFLPSFAVETFAYNQRVDESDKLILDYTHAGSGVIFMYSGTASIIDGKLIGKIQETSSIDGSKSSITLMFHR
ncbi:hypothetical protein J2Y45_003119 [Dyadobacter sp. BE34]|uniref:Lipocalin-like domain-containing protein n=1 Tax=Dyadobacter fermentans TaxID=94254 RepID=A0ABU1QUA5_9BACT|nr:MULTISPECIES: hypothetical protein [Dyadobacter]MDR6804572.1 hypothetical protein [Dyadobacter fermentans]MDR7043668.1 hypothetical protein [Dyadobacter sp. BE242]MDR7197980.1 hypothetical protein [Dyadobacter sp. BE34]MDR7214586.1 hypothetical protein [Dyadobacter sp. BE31]MDR7262121.1 hypothetical protein [Dyadobacter sp. BE32]